MLVGAIGLARGEVLAERRLRDDKCYVKLGVPISPA